MGHHRHWQGTALQIIFSQIIFWALLVGVTHQSLVPSPAPLFAHWSDKVLHGGAWMILAIAIQCAFPTVTPQWRLFLLLFGYSIAIEIGQIFVPGRFFSGLDIIANGLGCGIVWLAWLVRRGPKNMA